MRGNWIVEKALCFKIRADESNSYKMLISVRTRHGLRGLSFDGEDDSVRKA
jgi:hypothetical protein